MLRAGTTLTAIHGPELGPDAATPVAAVTACTNEKAPQAKAGALINQYPFGRAVLQARSLYFCGEGSFIVGKDERMHGFRGFKGLLEPLHEAAQLLTL